MTEAQENSAPPMLSGNWWALLFRGMVAVLFGLFALLWPGLTLAVLVVVYGAYALVDGILAVSDHLLARAGRCFLSRVLWVFWRAWQR